VADERQCLALRTAILTDDLIDMLLHEQTSEEIDLNLTEHITKLSPYCARRVTCMPALAAQKHTDTLHVRRVHQTRPLAELRSKAISS